MLFLWNRCTLVLGGGGRCGGDDGGLWVDAVCLRVFCSVRGVIFGTSSNPCPGSANFAARYRLLLSDSVRGVHCWESVAERRLETRFEVHVTLHNEVILFL